MSAMTACQPEVHLEAAVDSEAQALADLRVAAMRDSLERVGFVVTRPGQHDLLLHRRVIDPRHQGRGLGSAVLSRVFSEADLQGRVVRAGALKDSDANRFYARHGFEFVEQGDGDVYGVRRQGSVSPPGTSTCPPRRTCAPGLTRSAADRSSRD